MPARRSHLMNPGGIRADLSFASSTVDALVAHLGGPTAPIAPGPANRIIKAG